MRTEGTGFPAGSSSPHVVSHCVDEDPRPLTRPVPPLLLFSSLPSLNPKLVFQEVLAVSAPAEKASLSLASQERGGIRKDRWLPQLPNV